MAPLKKDIRYVSDFTQFINGFLEQNPEVARGQVEGRALLWDKDLDREFLKSVAESRVNQRPYVYQPE